MEPGKEFKVGDRVRLAQAPNTHVLIPILAMQAAELIEVYELAINPTNGAEGTVTNLDAKGIISVKFDTVTKTFAFPDDCFIVVN